MADGLVLEIQRMSTEDGPGLRTTVFLKGCPLRCEWCHNPESISPRPQVQWVEAKCIACGACAAVCEHNAIDWAPGLVQVDRDRCVGAGDCADACPATALELWGRRMSVDELVRELVKDRAYFERAGGGVTISGGEATAQPGFCLEVLKGLKAAGIGTAIDTCGLCRVETLDSLLPLADIVLFDLKLMDSTAHRLYCGTGNEGILENARHVARSILADETAAGSTVLWIRTPLIPGATATAENIGAIGRFIADELGAAVSRWDLCAFNHLGRDKYRRLGMDWPYRGTPLMTAAELEEMGAVARASGVSPGIVRVSGATRLDD